MSKTTQTERKESAEDRHHSTQEGRKVPDGNKKVFDALLKRACPPASEPEDETSEQASSEDCA